MLHLQQLFNMLPLHGHHNLRPSWIKLATLTPLLCLNAAKFSDNQGTSQDKRYYFMALPQEQYLKSLLDV